MNISLGNFPRIDKNRERAELEALAAKLPVLRNKQEEMQALIQEIRLYEIVCESGPQAVAQISYFFRIGLSTTWGGLFVQLSSIALSMISLASGSAESILHAPTRRHKIKEECSWMQTWLLVVPLCLTIIQSRILTAGLIFAYLRVYSLLLVVLFCFLIYLKTSNTILKIRRSG